MHEPDLPAVDAAHDAPGHPVVRWALAAALVVLLLTPVAAGIRAVADGWTPTGDQATFVVRIHDTAHGHPPLSGMPSTASRADRPVDHPGPLAFWVAAPADLLASGHGAGAVLAFASINGLALAGAVLVARRGLGDRAALAVALALGWLVVGLAGAPLYQPWNAHLAVLPTALLLVLTAAVAAGDRRLLPVLVAVASFVAQAHLAYLPLAGVLVAAAAVGSWPARRSGSGRAGRWAVAVGVACWSAPLLQLAVGSPRNLWAIASAGSGVAGEPVQGGRGAWRAVVDAVGGPPRWSVRNVADAEPVAATGAVSAAVAVLVVLAAVGLLVLAVRAGRRRESAALATALLAVLVAGALVARLPADVLTVASANSRRPLVVCGWYLWLALAASLVGAAARAWRRRPAATGTVGVVGPSRRSWAAAVGATVVVAALVVGAVVSVGRADPAQAGGAVAFGAVRTLAGAVPDDVIDAGPVLVRFEGGSAGALTGPGVVAELVGRGADVRVPRALTRSYGRPHRQGADRAAVELLVVSGAEAGRARPGYRLLGAYDPDDQDGTRWSRFERSVFIVPVEPSAIYERTGS